MAQQVTKSTMIGELLQINENIAPLLLNIGMHCLGCPSSQMEIRNEYELQFILKEGTAA